MTARAVRFVTPRFGADIIGGAESHVRQVALALVARDWDVEVWTTTAVDEATWESSTAPGQTSEDGISVRRFPTRWSRSPRLFHQLTRAFFRIPASLRPEWLWLRAQGPYAPDLVHALQKADRRPTLFMPYLFYPTLVGLPLAPHPRILMPAAHDERPLRLRAVSNAINCADALWCATPEEHALIVRTHPAAARKPHGIGNIGVEAPANVAPEVFINENKIPGPYLYYGGRQTPGKGFDLLLEGFSALRQRRNDVSLVVSGGANADDRKQADGMMDVGDLDAAQRWNAIAGASAVVVPGRHESLSLLALEAWATGRPTLLNGGSDVLRGQAERSGAALVFTAAADFATQALRLLTDPELQERKGESGRSYVQQTYEWDTVVASLEELIDRVTPR